MFACIECANKYTVEDIKKGLYFISTSTCLDCYFQLAHSRVRCFGKKNKYDPKVIACQECSDERLCRTYIKHKDQFKGE
jgi:hypothetical protein